MAREHTMSTVAVWRPRRALARRVAPLLFPAPAVVALLVIMGVPTVVLVFMSFNSYQSGIGEPLFVGLTQFEQLVADPTVASAIGTTIYFTVLAVGLELVLGTAIALLINREFPGRGIVRSLLMFPLMATPVAVALIWVLMFQPTQGVLNYLLSLVGIPQQLWLASPVEVVPALALVDIWEYTPFVTLIVLAALAAAPTEPVECARIDGANAAQILWHITLPLIRPAILVAALFRLIDSLKVFDTIYVMTAGGPGTASLTVNLYAYKQAFEYIHLGYSAAISVLLIVLVVAVSAGLVTRQRSST